MRRTDDNTETRSNEVAPNASNVVYLPNLRTGTLADLLSAASAPAQPHELSWEHGIRAAFQAERLRRTEPRRSVGRMAVVAVTIVTALIGGSAGLAAATGFPAPVARFAHDVLDTPKQAPPAASSRQVVGGISYAAQSTKQRQTADLSRVAARNTAHIDVWGS